MERLRYVILLTDSNGNVLIDSPAYDSIGIDSPDEIRRIMALKEPELHIRWDAAGTPYIIKAWVDARTITASGTFSPSAARSRTAIARSRRSRGTISSRCWRLFR